MKSKLTPLGEDCLTSERESFISLVAVKFWKKIFLFFFFYLWRTATASCRSTHKIWHNESRGNNEWPVAWATCWRAIVSSFTPVTNSVWCWEEYFSFLFNFILELSLCAPHFDCCWYISGVFLLSRLIGEWRAFQEIAKVTSSAAVDCRPNCRLPQASRIPLHFVFVFPYLF